MRRKRRRLSLRIALVSLQQAHMEYVVEAGTHRKLQAVGERADTLQHTKGPDIARPQLALGTRIQRLRRPVK
jgi:hypothetical protein